MIRLLSRHCRKISKCSMVKNSQTSIRAITSISLSSPMAASNTNIQTNIIRKQLSSNALEQPLKQNNNEEENILKSKLTQNERKEVKRLRHMRNVGIFAHVDAGKTTVTERMITLAGLIRVAGSVDNGNTLTDFLPMERERGISIQSAAISFEWAWHNNHTGQDYNANDSVQIHLIDTPGHVDFSLEVNRSVAVLDGAVLVLDAVAGVQAQTYTVWKAMNQHCDTFSHEPLPCIAVVNKMDKDEADFTKAIETMKAKLPHANPLPLHLPLFKSSTTSNCIKHVDYEQHNGEFLGVVDLVHMRVLVWNSTSNIVENSMPHIINLLHHDNSPIHPNCQITQKAVECRASLIASLADVDAAIEECFLLEEEPTNAELRSAIRRAVLSRQVLPVLAAASLKAKGIEPILDSIADYLPSPLDRLPPALHFSSQQPQPNSTISIGHPLHNSLVAYAFKVVHLKGKGSGDGRIVFARVYSGTLKAKDTLQCISPTPMGSLTKNKPKMERVGGMLQLTGGKFQNLDNAICKSGDVAALVGLKHVKTGDTIISSKNKNILRLGGVSYPKPVLTIRIEARNTSDEAKLSNALTLLSIEDPSLHVQEENNATLLSGLGELHMEIVLDRLAREFQLEVLTGPPAVAYKETITQHIDTNYLIDYDRTFGNTRMQAKLHIQLQPYTSSTSLSHIIPLSDPIITLEEKARLFLQLKNETEDELYYTNDVVKALINGCQGALKRGVIGPYPMTNLQCRIVDIDAEAGLKQLIDQPNTLRAATSHVISNLLKENKDFCTLLEPTMSIEILTPRDLVGNVLSDFNNRRGCVENVCIGEAGDTSLNSLIQGNVPLKEILGYANSLRSITGGEGSFAAEYLGHSNCSNF